jgi:hypothetical protein
LRPTDATCALCNRVAKLKPGPEHSSVRLVSRLSPTLHHLRWNALSIQIRLYRFASDFVPTRANSRESVPRAPAEAAVTLCQTYRPIATSTTSALSAQPPGYGNYSGYLLLVELPCILTPSTSPYSSNSDTCIHCSTFCSLGVRDGSQHIEDPYSVVS